MAHRFFGTLFTPFGRNTYKFTDATLSTVLLSVCTIRRLLDAQEERLPLEREGRSLYLEILSEGLQGEVRELIGGCATACC